MPKESLGKTGNAPIVKVGHTTNGQYGSDPNATNHVNPSRDLNVK